MISSSEIAAISCSKPVPPALCKKKTPTPINATGGAPCPFYSASQRSYRRGHP
jgi:hypothetical protein